MLITTVLLGACAIYVLIYGSGKHASVEIPSSYPATLGGPGGNDGSQQEQHYKRNTVDTNMIAYIKQHTNSEQPLEDGDVPN